MKDLVGACVFGQSGGPTAVINASAAGVFTEALAQKNITKVYGAAHGIEGIMNEWLYDIAKEDPKEIAMLKHTPSSALGSVRYKLKKESELKRILEVFRKYNVRYFFYNGGNDSMDTCNKVSKYLLKNNYECNVIGIPKTVDNDLVGTDHCPGYGSAAKFVSTSIMSMYLDATVYQKGQVTIVEIMGRDAGWLTASSALAAYKGCGPDLIYLPEQVFDRATFIAQVKSTLERNKGNCFVAVSEGIRFKDGKLVSSQPALENDKFGHARLGGVAASLEAMVNNALPKTKTRHVELNILQRCSSYVASAEDIKEAFEVARFAVRSACAGETDKMAAIARPKSGPYKAEYVLSSVDASANAVKGVPKEWILPDNRGLTQDFIDYALPLIQGEANAPFEDGLPRFARLKKVPVTSPSSL